MGAQFFSELTLGGLIRGKYGSFATELRPCDTSYGKDGCVMMCCRGLTSCFAFVFSGHFRAWPFSTGGRIPRASRGMTKSSKKIGLALSGWAACRLLLRVLKLEPLLVGATMLHCFFHTDKWAIVNVGSTLPRISNGYWQTDAGA